MLCSFVYNFNMWYRTNHPYITVITFNYSHSRPTPGCTVNSNTLYCVKNIHTCIYCWLCISHVTLYIWKIRRLQLKSATFFFYYCSNRISRQLRTLSIYIYTCANHVAQFIVDDVHENAAFHFWNNAYVFFSDCRNETLCPSRHRTVAIASACTRKSTWCVDAQSTCSP